MPVTTPEISSVRPSAPTLSACASRLTAPAPESEPRLTAGPAPPLRVTIAPASVITVPEAASAAPMKLTIAPFRAVTVALPSEAPSRICTQPSLPAVMVALPALVPEPKLSWAGSVPLELTEKESEPALVPLPSNPILALLPSISTGPVPSAPVAATMRTPVAPS